MDREPPVSALDRAALTGPVRSVVGSETAEIATWGHDLLYGGLGVIMGASAVYRVAGTARDRGQTRPWSLVLKILHDPTRRRAPDEAPLDGWDREVRAYRSGLLDALPDGLAAPRCYAIEERPGAIWLWLEDITDEIGPHWPIARFALAARHLGRLNGRSLTERPLPDDPWLLRGLLPVRAAAVSGFWEGFAQVRDEPLARRIWPGDLADRALRLWEERERIMAALDQLPQTFGHGDADRRNLFARRRATGEAETVAIDWAFVGVLPLGAELSLLVNSSVLWSRGVGADDLVALADSVPHGLPGGPARRRLAGGSAPGRGRLRGHGCSAPRTLARRGGADCDDPGTARPVGAGDGNVHRGVRRPLGGGAARGLRPLGGDPRGPRRHVTPSVVVAPAVSRRHGGWSTVRLFPRRALTPAAAQANSGAVPSSA